MLHDLIRVVRSYDLRRPHCLKARPCNALCAVSADGRSFTVQPVGGRGEPASAVSTCTLAEGPSRWRVRVPAGVQCYIGLADMRRLESWPLNTATIGAFVSRRVYSHIACRMGVECHPDREFTRDPDIEAVVQFEFDQRKRALAIGMAEGPSVQPLRTIFERMCTAAELTPIVFVTPPKSDGAKAVTVTTECDEE